MPVLLLIDDDCMMQEFVRYTFENSPVEVVPALSAGAGVECFDRQRPDVVLLDVGLPDMNGLDAFRQLRRIDARVPVIFITGGGTTETAIAAMALGAYEYLLKPLEMDILHELVLRAAAASELMRKPPVLTEGEADSAEREALLGRCAAMHAVFKAIGRVAMQETTVLILGESGTGKELVARAIYQHSTRANELFLPINCAAIPESLLESELFGHERGAFTGAEQRRIGKFEQCSGGTLFLDEIGDMTPLTQAKVLRVLQDQQFERLGGNEMIRTNVRILAATNRDLEDLVSSGKFREDLYYRLHVYPVRLPPLRERDDDITLLVNYFVKRYARDLKKEVSGVSAAAMAQLRQYPWPGNIRELQSAIKFALLQATGPIIVPEFLPPDITGARPHKGLRMGTSDLDSFIGQQASDMGDLYAQWLNAKEKELLERVLHDMHWNISAASKSLGISRGTLRARIASLGIAPP